jgi:hypothetical protein
MDSVVFNVGRKKLEFHEHFMMIDNERVQYSDIESVGFLLTNKSMYVSFIPAWKMSVYDVRIKTAHKTYKLVDRKLDPFAFETTKRKILQKTFGQIAYVLDRLVIPRLVEKMREEIRHAGSTNVGGLKITPAGIEKKRLFRSPVFLDFKKYFNSELRQGKLVVYERHNEKPKHFFACNMNTGNAPVVPALLLELLQNKIGAA